MATDSKRSGRLCTPEEFYPLVHKMYEEGSSFETISRALKADGYVSRRTRKPLSAMGVRGILYNPPHDRLRKGSKVTLPPSAQDGASRVVEKIRSIMEMKDLDEKQKAKMIEIILSA